MRDRVEVPRHVGVAEGVLDREGDLQAVGEADERAGLGDRHVDELVLAGEELLGEALEDRPSLGGRHPRPRSLVERAVGGPDGFVGLFGGGGGDPGDDLLGRRIDDVDELVGSRPTPRTVDEVAVVDVGVSHGRPPARGHRTKL